MSERWLSTTECAERLGGLLTRQTIAKYCANGGIKATRIDTGLRPIWKIREADFIAFVRRHVRDEWRGAK